MTDIEILYVNESDDRDDPTVLVFVHPPDPSSASETTAWEVIRKIGYHCWHKLIYTASTEVQITWNQGRSGTFPISVNNGKNYIFKDTDKGFLLEEEGNSSIPSEFSITNDVASPGGITITVLKDNKPILTKDGVAKGQTAEFSFHPRLYFGISSNQGEETLAYEEMSTEISLEGLSRATITLSGDKANGYTFHLSDAVPD